MEKEQEIIKSPLKYKNDRKRNGKRIEIRKKINRIQQVKGEWMEGVRRKEGGGKGVGRGKKRRWKG